MTKRTRDPFALVVPKRKQHRDFKWVANDPGYAPAREVIREIYRTFDDPDGNFVEQFQSTGFDARIWELCLHAFLSEAGFKVTRQHRRPDFMASKGGATVAVEAMTANPTQGARKVRPRKKWWTVTSPRTIRGRQTGLIPIKLGSILYSKLSKEYWKLPQVQGRPLVFAVESFFEPGSLWFGGGTLAGYLYGYDNIPAWDAHGRLYIIPKKIKRHRFRGKQIPSNFFSLPGAEHISAVLFSNSGTIAKFNRMGHQGRYRARDVRMLRLGLCHDPDPDSALPRKFFYEVGDPRFVEAWGQGLAIFHNEHALHPLPRHLFPGVMHARSDGGVLKCVIPAFFPMSSVTWVLRSGGKVASGQSRAVRAPLAEEPNP